MPEETTEKTEQRRSFLRYRGRAAQVWIYLGKLLRMFVYQNDWKVIPMAAVIAGVVAMVIRDRFFLTMEGTLMSAFALSCVAIWNGCFNSIQVICRERDVVKREHRSGMHISSYIAAHMIYQALLCLLQTGVTVYVMRFAGVQFPDKGLFTPFMIVDIGISMFLVSYASDALALWLSSLARSTTAAMTIMPFLLIFQLVFSGGMLSLPDWCQPLTKLTISGYGMTALASQADYNNRPMVTLWSTLVSMRDNDIAATFTVGQVMDYLADENNPGVRELRQAEFTQRMTVRELSEMVSDSVDTVDGAAELLRDPEFLREFGDRPLDVSFTLGEAVDRVRDAPVPQEELDRVITAHATIGQFIDFYGEYQTYQAIQKVAAANTNPKYENTVGNISGCWSVLILFTLCYAAMATITLEFIDKDKR